MFLSYTAVLMACALVFSSILLQQIVQRNHSLQEQQCRSDARLLAQVVDDKFTEIESIGAQLTSARWFQKVRSQSEILNASLTMLERQDICQQMQTYYAILQVAESVALLLPEKGQAVDRVSFWEEERYFSSVGLPGNLMDDPDVQDSLAASYNSMVVLPGKDGDFYVFKQLNYAAHPDAVLFCLINDSWFQQFLSQRFADSLGSLEIISEGEPVLFHDAGRGGPGPVAAFRAGFQSLPVGLFHPDHAAPKWLLPPKPCCWCPCSCWYCWWGRPWPLPWPEQATHPCPS